MSRYATWCFLTAFLAVISLKSQTQQLQLAADEPFSGQKTFCIELKAKSNLKDSVGNHSFLLTYILTLQDKGIDLTYKLNGRLKQSLKKADYTFQGQEMARSTGRYAFTFETKSRTTLRSFEVHGDSEGRQDGAEISECK